tara:strand:- start:196 stop:726 length:531 start_codon:yes stop_codon:yes gene_type:complete
MDSQTANEIKSEWKNIIKPQLRDYIEGVREIYNENILIMNRGRNIEQDFSRLMMKNQKLDMFAMTYIYNEDYDNAVKYVNKYKEFAYELIEKVEKMSKDNYMLGLDSFHGVKGVTQRKEITTGEGSYIKLCKQIKKGIEYNEKLLYLLSAVICEVKDIRKADKKMRKRKKKKQGNV